MQLPFSKQSYIARLMQMYFRCELISSFFFNFYFLEAPYSLVFRFL